MSLLLLGAFIALMSIIIALFVTSAPLNVDMASLPDHVWQDDCVRSMHDVSTGPGHCTVRNVITADVLDDILPKIREAYLKQAVATFRQQRQLSSSVTHAEARRQFVQFTAHIPNDSAKGTHYTSLACVTSSNKSQGFCSIGVASITEYDLRRDPAVAPFFLSRSLARLAALALNTTRVRIYQVRLTIFPPY
jgi:hypothetical protein